MDLYSLLLFSAALTLAAASPGPSVAAIVGHVLGRGPSRVWALTLGVIIGDVVWLTAAVLGLAALAQHFHTLFMIIKYVGAAYLLYLAWRMWTAPAHPSAPAADKSDASAIRLCLTGIALTLGNPKAIGFYLALLPTLLDLRTITLVGYMELALAVFVVLSAVFGVYIALVARARAAFSSTRAMRILNRTGAAAMTGAALNVAAR